MLASPAPSPLCSRLSRRWSAREQVVSRVAIIGSCITRDLWPNQGEAPPGLLYISRTSLPSLFSRPMGGIETTNDPPPGLARGQHEAVVTDLKKRALARLVAHGPTHIVFDFIDERFDLLVAGQAKATHSWELETTGYMNHGDMRTARRIPRLSQACEQLWADAALEMASLLASTPLRTANVLLHRAQWADRYRSARGRLAPLPDEATIWEGRTASRSEHNTLLETYEETFLSAVPNVRTVAAASHRIADESHRWGLSPFHYVPDYYAAIRDQLAQAGV